MYRIKKLTVRGFRGFVNEVEFHFDTPHTILFGGNHSSKSSTANAIEWCLFGDDVVGKDTGFRERIGWRVDNCHHPDGEVRVSIELTCPSGVARVRRVTRVQRKQRRRTLKTLEVALHDGELLNGPEAEAELAAMIDGSFRDFSTSIYLHQENVRAILTDEPQRRNDAIDRLLGLSRLKNLISGIKNSKCAQRHKQLVQQFEKLQTRIETALTTRSNDLDEATTKAIATGLNSEDLTEEAARRLAEAAGKSLVEFAENLGVACELPCDLGKWGIDPLLESLSVEVTRLRAELPGLGEQTRLHTQQAALAHHRVSVGGVKERLHKAREQTRQAVAETGGRETVAERFAQASKQLLDRQRALAKASRRAALVHMAIDYLAQQAEALPNHSLDSCPLCEQSAPGLLTNLREQWAQSLQNAAQGIEAQISATREQLEELRRQDERLAALDREVDEAASQWVKAREAAAAALNHPLAKQDDIEALLRLEIERIGRQLEQVATRVARRQQDLSQIERQLQSVRTVAQVLSALAKLDSVQRIQESAEYRQLEHARDQLAGFVECVRRISDAVMQVLNQEAAAKIAAAGDRIRDYFSRLAEHPVFSDIQVVVESKKSTGQNDYKFLDSHGNDVAPLLSQGDYNALALAIFLGLGQSAGAAAFGLVILDDPSQSLGDHHKQRLVELLDEVGRDRQVIIATMDNELRRMLDAGLSSDKTTYHFRRWTAESGPEVELAV